jgi:hypothetical protein
MLLLPQYATSLLLDITWLSGQAPVQAEGAVAGLPFYFRARWDYWTFSVAQTTSGDPVQVLLGAEEGYNLQGAYGAKGECEASWMPHGDAWRIIGECVQEYARCKVRDF